MNDTTTTQTEAATPAAEAKKATLDLVPDRRIFADLAAAGVALAAIAEQASDFANVQIVAPGATFDAEGNFVPEAAEWTADSHEIMLAPLATKAVKDSDGKVTKPARLIALVLSPIPTLDALTADDKGLAMVAEVIRKELNHRAVRKLRTAENVLAAATEMPLSIESFATSQAGGTATGLVAFDEHWLLYSQALAKKVPAWAARFPGGKGKAAIRGAVENAAKAQALFPELESFGEAGSLFVRLLQGVINKATAASQDTTLLQAWLDTRDQQTYDAATDAAEAVDFDALFDDMGSESEAEAEGDDAGDPPTVTDETAEAETTE